MKKIVISGKRKTGKGTLCNMFKKIINDNYSNYNYYSLSFADPIKEIAKIFFPQIKDEWLFGDTNLRETIIPNILLNNKQVSVRDLLIDIGEGYKKYDPNIWVNRFDYRVKELSKDPNSIIFGIDLRFTQEFEYIKNNDFISIRLIKEDVLKSNSFTEVNQESIPNSEFDYIIYNDSDLKSLYNKAENILFSIFK